MDRSYPMDAQAAYVEKVAAEADETTRQAEALKDFWGQVAGQARQPCPREPPQDKSSILPKMWEDSTETTVPQPPCDLTWADFESRMVMPPEMTLNTTPLAWGPIGEETMFRQVSSGSDDTLIGDPSQSLAGLMDFGLVVGTPEKRDEDLYMNPNCAAPFTTLKMPSLTSTLDARGASQLKPNTSRSVSSQIETKSSSMPNLTQSPLARQHSDDELANHQTNTSTPESSSFWLAEYSDDGIEKLREDHPFMPFKSLAVVKVFERLNLRHVCLVEQDIAHGCNGAGNPNPSVSQDKGKQKDSAKRKGTHTDRPEAGEDITGSSGPSSNQIASVKRRRTSDRKLTFACPYTKKDPMTYRDCYKYTLSRIRDVKQHLARCHRNPPYCPRCMGTFQAEEERDQHIREFSCPSRPSVTLDGITESQRFQLAKKSLSNTSPEAQWFAVFDIVFPGHDSRPRSPYVDSELLQDITLYQDFMTSHGPSILSMVLDQRGAISWNLPNEEQDLAAFQQTVFEEGLGIIFQQWLARRSGSAEHPSIPSSSASTGQDTPPSSSHSREITSIQDSGALPPEPMESLPIGRPPNATIGSEDMAGSSSGPIHQALGEGSDATFNFEHGEIDFLSGLLYDGSDDELVRLMMADAPASSDFQTGLG